MACTMIIINDNPLNRQVTGPTESSPDDKQQQRAQAAASIEAGACYVATYLIMSPINL